MILGSSKKMRALRKTCFFDEKLAPKALLCIAR